MKIIRKINGGLIDVGKNLISLLYPSICPGCKKEEVVKSQHFCMDCIYRLRPQSWFHLKNNKFTRHFFGRVPIEDGAALFTYGKEGLVKNMIRELKYHGDKDVGIVCGELLGEKIAEAEWGPFNYIVPVPLHPKKKLSRGYNQAHAICEGISKSISVPIRPLVKRVVHSISQTKKGRHDRIEALQDVFVFNQKYQNLSDGIHILLVDDVVTTGATLEACALAILKYKNVRISMCTIGIGRY